MNEARFGEWMPTRTSSQVASSTADKHQFRAFLEQHRLTLLDVARAADVRLMTVWNVQQGRPVRPQSAQAVCAALYRLSGMPYSGPIVVKDSNE